MQIDACPRGQLAPIGSRSAAYTARSSSSQQESGGRGVWLLRKDVGDGALLAPIPNCRLMNCTHLSKRRI